MIEKIQFQTKLLKLYLCRFLRFLIAMCNSSADSVNNTESFINNFNELALSHYSKINKTFIYESLLIVMHIILCNLIYIIYFYVILTAFRFFTAQVNKKGLLIKHSTLYVFKNLDLHYKMKEIEEEQIDCLLYCSRKRKKYLKYSKKQRAFQSNF